MSTKVIDVDLDALDRDGIAQAQNITASTAMTLNGALGTSLDYARIIGIYSGADVSGANFTIVGTNSNGESITESSIVGPNNATVVSTKKFKTIVSVTPDATVAQNVEVGNVATTLSAESSVHPINFKSDTAATYYVDVTGTINYTLQECFMNPFSNTVDNLTWVSLSALTAKTADTVAAGTARATAVKILINSYSSGAELQVHINSN